MFIRCLSGLKRESSVDETGECPDSVVLIMPQGCGRSAQLSTKSIVQIGRDIEQGQSSDEPLERRGIKGLQTLHNNLVLPYTQSIAYSNRKVVKDLLASIVFNDERPVESPLEAELAEERILWRRLEACGRRNHSRELIRDTSLSCSG